MIRYINGILSLGIIAVLWIHIIGDSCLLAGFIPFTFVFQNLGFIAAFLILVHAAVSLVFVVQRLLKKTKQYPAVNKAFIIQHAAGLIMIIAIALHIYAMKTGNPWGMLCGSPVLSFIVSALLILSIAVHTIMGIPRAFILLGLLKTKSGIKRLYAVSCAVVILPSVFSILAFANYFLISLSGAL